MRDHPDPGQIHKLEVFRSLLILADYVPNTQGTSARSGIVLLVDSISALLIER
jgi:hypothetical protein